MRKVIVITGTPGTGKTVLAERLSKRINARLIKANEVVEAHRLFSSYSEDGAKIVKMKRLGRLLNREVMASRDKLIVLEGHLLCDIKINGATAIVLREHLPTLKRRLIKRGYSISKVRDNIVSEAIDYCGESARSNYGEVHELLNNSRALGLTLRIINGKLKEKGTIELLHELETMMRKDKRFAI